MVSETNKKSTAWGISFVSKQEGKAQVDENLAEYLARTPLTISSTCLLVYLFTNLLLKVSLNSSIVVAAYAECLGSKPTALFEGSLRTVFLHDIEKGLILCL